MKWNENTYHAAMLFVKRLEMELQGCDLQEWIFTELRSKRICKTCHELKPVGEYYANSFYNGRPANRFECIMCVREKYRIRKENMKYKQAQKLAA